MSGSLNPPLRVAIADDDSDMREILIRFLVKLGHEVCLVATNGDELLEGFPKQSVDVIITDLDMPFLDGLAAAEELSRFEVPVILISGHADLELIRREREPIIAALRKPLNLQSLEQAIVLATLGDNSLD